jgi:hypothetical protein
MQPVVLDSVELSGAQHTTHTFRQACSSSVDGWLVGSGIRVACGHHVEETLAAVTDIAVDGTSVYWTSTMDGVTKLTPK